tara:strand:+ start:451 stop:1383 length:933 start_codon:yes stop_codon:yes gene_type:complete
MITPAWAARHHYYHHKNSKSAEPAKELFDKCHVRPLVKKAWDIVRTSVDDFELETAWQTINRLDRKHNESANSKMWAGTVVQWACDEILINQKDPVEIYELALKKFMDHTVRTWDNGKDARDWEICAEVLTDTIRSSVEGLREVMSGQHIVGESELKGCLFDNELPHINLPDYVGVGDLKTKWPQQDKRSKSGKKKASLPKALDGMFTINNVFQVAGGWYINGRKPVWLLYANESGYAIFNQDNCEQLQPEFLEQCCREMYIHHRAIESNLKAHDSKESLLLSQPPNFSHISWSEPPGVIEEAKRIWGIK